VKGLLDKDNEVTFLQIGALLPFSHESTALARARITDDFCQKGLLVGSYSFKLTFIFSNCRTARKGYS
jgi:hypothetical protein